MAIAKKKEGENEEVEWTADQPIPDEDGEDAAQKKFMIERRVKHLHEEADKQTKKKKKGGWM
jgi:hypothetical protein